MKLSKLISNTTPGVWLEYMEGFEVLVAPHGNQAYDKMIRKLTRPIRTRRRKGTMKDDEMEVFNKRATAKHLLLDWKGLEEDNGELIPYSSNKALEIFNADADGYEFYKQILVMAHDLANEKAAVNEETEKNLETS